MTRPEEDGQGEGAGAPAASLHVPPDPDSIARLYVPDAPRSEADWTALAEDLRRRRAGFQATDAAKAAKGKKAPAAAEPEQ